MRLILAAVVALVGVTRTGWAQVQVEVEPAIGVYSGFSSWPRPSSGEFFNFPDTLSQRTAVAFGGQATAWFGRRFGLRASVLTSTSEVGSTAGGLFSREPVQARVATVGFEALVPVAQLSTGGHVFLAGGATIIRRSGDAYKGFDGTKDVGGMIGVGSQFRLTDRFFLQTDLRALLYQLQLTDPDGLQYPSAFQTDLQGYLGFSVRLSAAEE